MARLFNQYFSSTLFDDEFKRVTDDMMKMYPKNNCCEPLDISSN